MCRFLIKKKKKLYGFIQWTGNLFCDYRHRAAPKAGKVTYVNDTRFPTAPRILGSRHHILYIFFYLGLLTTNIARSGKRQVPFLKPHLVTVTDTRQTSRKFVVNFFPKQITPWPGQD